MKKRTMIFSFALAGMVSLLCAPVFGQGGARGRAYTKSDVERIIKRVETNSDKFKDKVDKTLDRSLLDGTRTEDNINEQVKDLEKALDTLRRRFDREDLWRETRSEVSAVMQEARDINGLFQRVAGYRKVKRGWDALRYDLNTLAGVYNLPRLR